MSEALALSPGVALLPEELRREYLEEYEALVAEIQHVEGAHTLLRIMLDRTVFVHCFLRDMEKDFTKMNMQRYNQLTNIWAKMMSDLLDKYKALYNDGAANDILAGKIIGIVGESLKDQPDKLTEIRDKILATKSTIGG